MITIYACNAMHGMYVRRGSIYRSIYSGLNSGTQLHTAHVHLLHVTPTDLFGNCNKLYRERKRLYTVAMYEYVVAVGTLISRS